MIRVCIYPRHQIQVSPWLAFVTVGLNLLLSNFYWNNKAISKVSLLNSWKVINFKWVLHFVCFYIHVLNLLVLLCHSELTTFYLDFL